ncbi:MAG: class I SAM-dependent methyltransferase [Deltaproteobacteria bacterium]|nr:class I SAM-dependent methyltransferase [Deltaproteobacteria bacterium]
MTFLPAIKSKAPIYLTRDTTIKEIIKLLPKTRPFTFIDLGCGTGTVICKLAKVFPNGYFMGVELSPVLFIFSFLRAKLFRNVRVKFGSIFRTDLSNFDFVYMFLSPVANKLLAPYLKDLKRKTIISNSFPIEELKLAKRVDLSQPLFIYKL